MNDLNDRIMWRIKDLNATWLILIRECHMTHSWCRRTHLMNATWLIRECHMTQSHSWMPLIRECHMTHSWWKRTHLIHTYMTHSYVCHDFIGHRNDPWHSLFFFFFVRQPGFQYNRLVYDKPCIKFYLSAPLTLMRNEIRYPIGVRVYLYIYLYMHIYTIISHPSYVSAPLTLMHNEIRYPIGVGIYLYIYICIYITLFLIYVYMYITLFLILIVYLRPLCSSATRLASP